MVFFNSNFGKLPFRLGCLATAAYLFVFFYYFPSANSSFLYVLLWILGFFMMPVIISVIFGAGTILGFLMSVFMNIFRIRRKSNEHFNEYHQEPDSSTYINIDEYNKPPEEKGQLN